MQITDEHLAQMSYYARMTPADMRRAWVTPRPAVSVGTHILDQMVALGLLVETDDSPRPRPATWRYRTGRRKR